MAVLFDEQGNYVGPSDPNDPLLNPTTAPPGRGAEVTAARNAAVAASLPKTAAEEIEPNPLLRGAAAFHGAIMEPVHGAAEKLELMFPGKGKAAEVAQRIGNDRAERRGIQQQLEETSAGMVGGILGKGAPYAVAASPAGVAGVGAITGFLGGGPDNPEGLFNELGTSAFQGGVDAATAYLPARGMQLAGKTIGATTGQLTKEGLRAKEVEAAAKRLGLPTPSFGQVYPNSGMAHFEQLSPTHAKLVNEQAEALRNAITKGTAYGVDDVGGAYLDQLKNAVAKRYNLGSSMYAKVDDIIQQNGLGNFMPNYTANVVTNVNHPGYQVAADEVSKYAFDLGSMAGMKAHQLGKIPLRFEDFNKMRIATNKAWGNINRSIENAQFNGSPVSEELKSAKAYLNQLRTALDNDADRWATQNAGNGEAVKAFRDATAYWKDQVVPTVIENPFARKVSSARRGFPTGESATRLSLSTANTPLVDRLLPTMSSRGADMTEIMRTLPEVRATALTGEAAQMPRGPAHAFAQAIEGPHTASILEKLAANIPVLSPGLRWSASSTPVRRLYGARDILTGTQPQRGAVYSTVVPWGSSALQEYGKERIDDRGNR